MESADNHFYGANYQQDLDFLKTLFEPTLYLYLFCGGYGL